MLSDESPKWPGFIRDYSIWPSVHLVTLLQYPFLPSHTQDPDNGQRTVGNEEGKTAGKKVESEVGRKV